MAIGQREGCSGVPEFARQKSRDRRAPVREPDKAVGGWLRPSSKSPSRHGSDVDFAAVCQRVARGHGRLELGEVVSFSTYAFAPSRTARALDQRDEIDLNQSAPGKLACGHRGAGGLGGAEVLRVDFVHRSEVSHVFEKDRGLDHALHG